MVKFRNTSGAMAAAQAAAAKVRADNAMAVANNARTAANAAKADADALKVDRDEYLAALQASVLDRAALHATVADLQSRLSAQEARAMTPGSPGKDGTNGINGKDGAKGDTGPSGTANLALGAAPVGLLALGASTTVTVPLSRTMPNTTYTVQPAHSAVVNLSGVAFTVVTKTTTAVQIKVQLTGVALVAGTLIVAAY